jgi:hypothetical protein
VFEDVNWSRLTKTSFTSGLLWTWQWTFGFSKSLRFYVPAEPLLGSRYIHCCLIRLVQCRSELRLLVKILQVLYFVQYNSLITSTLRQWCRGRSSLVIIVTCWAGRPEFFSRQVKRNFRSLTGPQCPVQASSGTTQATGSCPKCTRCTFRWDKSAK